MAQYDAVLILGGGVRPGGVLPEWVDARFERAAKVQAEWYICLSGGTAHAPSPVDANGRTIFESVAGARRLTALGIPPGRILLETASYDTIGNAYFSRVIHLDRMTAGRLLVITSEFHMPRTQAIFRWVFGLDDPGYNLAFEATPDVGLEPSALKIRLQRERASLTALEDVRARIASLTELHRWLFSEHQLYSVRFLNSEREAVDERIRSTYR